MLTLKFQLIKKNLLEMKLFQMKLMKLMTSMNMKLDTLLMVISHSPKMKNKSIYSVMVLERPLRVVLVPVISILDLLKILKLLSLRVDLKLNLLLVLTIQNHGVATSILLLVLLVNYTNMVVIMLSQSFYLMVQLVLILLETTSLMKLENTLLRVLLLNLL
eukprot:jgi/Orpsp1_1/1189421/evm.model.d7180000071922.1